MADSIDQRREQGSKGEGECAMDTIEIVYLEDQRWPLGWCPRCRVSVPLVPLTQAAKLAGEASGEHLVLLPTGGMRVCFGLARPSDRFDQKGRDPGR